jgi:hypothetical protein
MSYTIYAAKFKQAKNSNTTAFFRFVNKWAIYRLGIISLAHAPVHVTDFPVVNVPVDELSPAWIWQHKLCTTLSAHVNINYRLPIKVYYRFCTGNIVLNNYFLILLKIICIGIWCLFMLSMLAEIQNLLSFKDIWVVVIFPS